MTHVYNDTFFDYIDAGARRSARAFIELLGSWCAPQSVLDLGCGRGVWLDEWRKSGVADLLGVDGEYVNKAELAIPPQQFHAGDLTKPLGLEKRFDLAQSLEVGEHLPEAASDALVDSLVAASDRVLFSAAVVGQGGEYHINEQPLSYWQAKFEQRGYRAYDCLRPALKSRSEVEPWYRYNAVLYVKETAADGLPEAIRGCALPDGAVLKNAGDPLWRLRRSVVSVLPRATVTRIAQTRASLLAASARKQAPAKV